MAVINKKVTAFIDGSEVTEKIALNMGKTKSVGNGGEYLAESMVDIIRQIAYENEYDVKAVYGSFKTPEDFIDLAAGEAVRDIVVCAAVLKHQLKLKPERSAELSKLFAPVVRQNPDFTPKTTEDEFLESLLGAVKLHGEQESLKRELMSLFQTWIEDDQIEGEFSNETVLHRI